MSEQENTATYRLNKIAKELNISIPTIVEFMDSKGVAVEVNPNTKIDADVVGVLRKEFAADAEAKLEAESVSIEPSYRDIETTQRVTKPAKQQDTEELLIKNVGATKDTVEEPAPAPVVEPKPAKVEVKKVEVEKVEPKAEPVAEPPKEVKAEPKVAAKEESKVESKEEVKAEKPKVTETVSMKQTLKSPTVVDKIDLEALKKGKKAEPKAEPKEEKKEAKKEAKKEEKTPVVEAKPLEKEEKIADKKTEKQEPVSKEKSEDKVEKPVVAEKTITPEPPAAEDEKLFRVETTKLEGPKFVGKIDLPEPKRKPVVSSDTVDSERHNRKRRRKRTDVVPARGGSPATTPGAGGAKPAGGPRTGAGGRVVRPAQTRGKREPKAEPTEKEIKDQIKENLAKLSAGKSKGTGKKRRGERRNEREAKRADEREAEAERANVIKVTEFVSANELSRMIDVPVVQVISTCMQLGIFVSINQRLDAETLALVAEEFGYKVEFVSADVQESIPVTEDTEEQLKARAPIVTVMGHVDHGKTSLLDYVRKANVISGEAGGITQHIGAYEVLLENGKKIAFLDTPGHEAFTAMRARGAKVTDIVIIVIAADDSVMPQTIEAINHAQAAGVPIVFALNKVDKPDANPDKIREQLSAMNILVEEWGGKYQCQEISAKKGLNVEILLEKVLLEAELLDLKANPDKNAVGTVIESSLDKGRGYITTMLIQAGTLKVGDVVLAGCHSGRVKAMFNERGGKVEEAGPSTPVLMLGMSGAPQAGDLINVLDDEREARDIANKRLQLQREQGIRTQKHITLDEIGRRLAIGNFKELNVIVKGDVDGSVEALADSILKLGNAEIQVNVIHKSVGQITESDVLLASASNAIIIGFQVRPSLNVRKLAENEQIDIRLYSIIYNAINELKLAMEGMLAPEFEEKIICNIDVRETFTIPKIGTVAGCKVQDGKVTRNTKIRVIRDGIVIHTGTLSSLKRFKDDVKEVIGGYECGLSVNNFNDVQVGDNIEGFEEVSIKRTLA